MAQRYLPLALGLIAFAGTLAISSWRAIRLHSHGVSTVEVARMLSPETPQRVAAAVATASLSSRASFRAMAVLAPASSATARAQIWSSVNESTGSAAVSADSDDLERAARENPVAPHSARTR